MTLCAKCHKNNATVHITSIMCGVMEKLDLCEDCASIAGYKNPSLEKIMARSVIGKKCEFCGREAYSGGGTTSSTIIYWCFDCNLECSRIRMELLTSEHPDWIQRFKEGSSALFATLDPEFIAWSEAAIQKSVRMLKDRRRQDGRDKGS